PQGAHREVNTLHHETYSIHALRLCSGQDSTELATHGINQEILGGILRCYLRRFCNSARTVGCTKLLTSPPSAAISRTRLDDTKVYCSAGVKNIVSTSPAPRCRFMVASWNSNSKSDTARKPRRMTWIPCCRAKSTVSTAKPVTSTLGTSVSTARAMATRCSRLNAGALPGLAAIATTTLSNSRAARRTRSWCPLVMGSNVPGYKALTVIRAS